MTSVQQAIAPLVPDPLGGVRCKLFPPGSLQELLRDGYNFDGSSCGFCSVEDSDLVAKPDPSTELDVDGYKLFICDIYKAGERSDLDSRFALERAVERLSEADLGILVGAEVEFYVLRRRSELSVLDPWRYMEVVPEAHALSLATRLLRLANPHVKVHFIHHEVGPGQYELTLMRDGPRGLADRIILLKWAVRYWVSREGLVATFMPKPFIDRPGNGMHIHFSLQRGGRSIMGPGGRREDGRAIFSGEAASFIAGVLEHARALSILTSPTVNSYKRLMPGFEAPIYICWGIGNRSALSRVPEHAAARGRLRVELRSPDPSCNPYLALAGII
ncbi:glutamine synthetase, partial [Candidatus Bathyarchaeota archaeon]